MYLQHVWRHDTKRVLHISGNSCFSLKEDMGG